MGKKEEAKLDAKYKRAGRERKIAKFLNHNCNMKSLVGLNHHIGIYVDIISDICRLLENHIVESYNIK